MGRSGAPVNGWTRHNSGASFRGTRHVRVTPATLWRDSRFHKRIESRRISANFYRKALKESTPTTNRKPPRRILEMFTECHAALGTQPNQSVSCGLHHQPDLPITDTCWTRCAGGPQFTAVPDSHFVWSLGLLF